MKTVLTAIFWSIGVLLLFVACLIIGVVITAILPFGLSVLFLYLLSLASILPFSWLNVGILTAAILLLRCIFGQGNEFHLANKKLTEIKENLEEKTNKHEFF